MKHCNFTEGASSRAISKGCSSVACHCRYSCSAYEEERPIYYLPAEGWSIGAINNNVQIIMVGSSPTLLTVLRKMMRGDNAAIFY